MKIYITFGQIHTHNIPEYPSFDKDSVAEIECECFCHGRDIAFDMFGDEFASSYSEVPDMSYYPRGIIKIDRLPKKENGATA